MCYFVERFNFFSQFIFLHMHMPESIYLSLDFGRTKQNVAEHANHLHNSRIIMSCIYFFFCFLLSYLKKIYIYILHLSVIAILSLSLSFSLALSPLPPLPTCTFSNRKTS